MTDIETGLTALHYTAAQWDISIAKFLISKGAKIDCTDSKGRTPLHIAAYSNHTDMMQFLLENGGTCGRMLTILIIMPAAHFTSLIIFFPPSLL